MVPGNHHDADAGPPGFGHGGCRFFPGRVQDPDDADVHQCALVLLVEHVHLVAVRVGV
jgi:hypothetical protein